jgi:WD40 repeat protein
VPRGKRGGGDGDRRQSSLVGPGGIQVHKLPGGDKLMEFPNQPGDHHCLAFSPAGDLLAVGGDKEIEIWDLGKKAIRKRLKGHAAGTTAVVFSPDGKSLLSAGEIVIASPIV